MEIEDARQPAGLPPPSPLTPLLHRLVRAAQALLALLMCAWVFSSLGGLRLRPRQTPESPDSNSTSELFNWHPLLQTLAFPLCMAEALLAYRAPLPPLPAQRPLRKAYHVALQTTAVLAAALGTAAAILSHTLKRPSKIPNFYSVHSVLGLATLVLLAAQFVLGFGAYLWPKLSLAQRRALGPWHRLLGLSVFSLGCCTMALGLQEKATFAQLGAGAGVRSTALVLPALMVLVLVLLAAAVVALHVLGGDVPAVGSGTGAVRAGQEERVPLFGR